MLNANARPALQIKRVYLLYRRWGTWYVIESFKFRSAEDLRDDVLAMMGVTEARVVQITTDEEDRSC